MKYAIIQSGSKQYKVSEGDEILLEKLDGEKGEKITFEDVLLVADADKIKVGTPRVNNFRVIGKIVSQTKANKIRVATYKAKSRYRKVKGHRQHLTKVAITNIKSSRKTASQSTKEKTKTPKKK